MQTAKDGKKEFGIGYGGREWKHIWKIKLKIQGWDREILLSK